MSTAEIMNQIRSMFSARGSSLYGGEAVTQLEHALQAAFLAEQSGADAAAISSALLHDIGHLLHDLPEDAPDEGVDDVHEKLAHVWLRKHFGDEVVEPVRLHVDAKRYLCAVDATYYDSLSEPSKQSLRLQGGPFDEQQARDFEQHPLFARCVQLRHWDDEAKIVDLSTPDLDHFMSFVEKCHCATSETGATS